MRCSIPSLDSFNTNDSEIKSQQLIHVTQRMNVCKLGCVCVCIAKYSKRITLKQKYIIICGYIIPLYSIKIHFFLTLHFQSIRMLHPYFILNPRLRRKMHSLRKPKGKIYIPRIFYSMYKISDARVFPFKDAHLHFRASTTFKHFP